VTFRRIVIEFISPVRRQTQRSEISYRQRGLGPGDVTIVSGLPATTVERTIADLVEARTDLSLVADVLGGAVRKSRLDLTRLEQLLAPLSARNGFPRSQGAALLNRLLDLSGAVAGLTADLQPLAARQGASNG
jgi:hypothetical protein